MPNISDKEFVKELFETYRQAMYKVALGILHNKADAEDAVQNAFLSIINNLEKISQIPCNERVFYLVNITENASINILKKEKRHMLEDIDACEDMVFDYSVEKKADEELMAEEIEAALNELSDRDYSLMYLYIFKQMKPREIAKKLDIPYGNIRVSIKRARERLIKILKRRGFDYEL